MCLARQEVSRSVARVVGVRFRRVGKIYSFDCEYLQLAPGEPVIVETARGLEYGEVVLPPRHVADEDLPQPLKKIVRRASDQDREQVHQNLRDQAAAAAAAREKIRQHGLEMKLVEAEYTFDRSKLVLYFSAEGRVDFRELLKDLSATLKTRIELRQIGARDEAKLVGGLGPCGRELCCTSWLTEFMPVSIRMAKDQDLSLNPTKISGLCGRLMCCLRYEHGQYEEARARLPAVGSRLRLPEGEAEVVGLNPLDEAVQVRLPDGRLRLVSVDALEAAPVPPAGR